jgi:outer membrane protein OmpA-like peptidoglycan-associated protein
MPPAPPPPGPTVNGLCGSANGVASVVQPTDDLCTTGTVTVISGQGPWNWNCIGQNGGMTVSCTAPLEPPAPITGACGSASGVPTLVTPRSGLCAAGISSAVSGSGPWTWSCSGTNGGGAVACVAPLAGGGTGSLPSFVTPSGMTAPGAPAGAAPMYASPSPQNTGLVTPQLPSGTLPPIETGNMPQMPPTQAFPAAPEATSAPEALPPATPQFAPVEAPELPDAAPLTPPPVRDTIQPSPALTAPAVNGLGQPIPGNHFVLSDDISSISFAAGSENISPAATPALDKLANILQANGDVRITLTAYAAVGPNTTPRDARRLSLARALAIRDYLTTKGVSSGRIDVRALGANVPSGDMDRVDVKAN